MKSKKITINLLTIFPNIFNSYINESILGRAQKKKLVKFKSTDIRKYSRDKHRRIDAKPYGGGAGMIMQVEPIFRALQALKKSKIKNQKSKNRSATILLSASGKIFTQNDAQRLSKYDELTFICGRYEGVDARIKNFVDEEISIGEYILTGGELPAMVITDSIIRLIPGVITEESLKEESFSSINHSLPATNYKEYPQYTRPEVFKYRDIKTGKIKKLKVPKILLSGNHKDIEKWRKEHSSYI